MVELRRFDIYLIKLNPTAGSEIQKTRPCIIVSPDEMNILHTVIVAPLTSRGFEFVFRPKINFQEKRGLVVLDQIRAVDRSRLIKKIGRVDAQKSKEIADTLVAMFAYQDAPYNK